MTKNMTLVLGLLLAVLLAQPRLVDAQMQVRLSAGKTFATLEGRTRSLFAPIGQSADHGTETGFFAGASLSLPLGRRLSVSPGVYFVQKGSSFEFEFPTGEGSLELSYIEVPVTVDVTVTGGDLGASLFAGPEIAFEVDCDLEFNATDTFFIHNNPFLDCGRDDVDESDRKSIDVGVVFGADVSVGPFFVRGGRNMGLTSLDDDWDLKNSAWFLGGGIVIGGPHREKEAVAADVDGQARIRMSAGATFATLEGDDAGLFPGDHGTETGFFAGASLSVPLGGRLSVSPGLYYVQKGAFFDGEPPLGSVELSYIEVPVTIDVAVTGADRPVGTNLFAGLEIAFEIDCALEERFGFSYGQFDDCRPSSEVEESERKSVDLGLVFGADVSIGGPFFVRGGLDLGLTSLDDTGAGDDFKNSAWFLGAGIVIGG